MKQSMSSGLKKTFFVIISGISAITSFFFFTLIFDFVGVTEAGDAAGIIGVIVTGLVGVIVLDGAAIVWLKIYLGASDNNDERSLAVIGMAVGFTGSALSTLSFLIMFASDVEIPANYSSYITWAMAVITVVHFALVFLSSYKSTQSKIDEKISEVLADGIDEMLKLTEQDFREQIPNLAQENASRLVQKMAGQFAGLSVFKALQGGSSKRLPAPSSASPAVDQFDLREVIEAIAEQGKQINALSETVQKMTPPRLTEPAVLNGIPAQESPN